MKIIIAVLLFLFVSPVLAGQQDVPAAIPPFPDQIESCIGTEPLPRIVAM